MKTKTCTKCEQTKPLAEMVSDKSRKSGYKNLCRNCHNFCGRKFYSRAVVNSEFRRNKTLTEITSLTCSKCNETKPTNCFVKSTSSKNGFSSHCKDCKYIGNRNWVFRNRERCRKLSLESNKRAVIKIRSEVIKAYGGNCVCCGENEPNFLSIDHIFNDGSKERKNTGSGTNFYKHLKKQGFPKDRYQLLCFNCNLAKGFYGSCPHQKLPNKVPADRVTKA